MQTIDPTSAQQQGTCSWARRIFYSRVTGINIDATGYDHFRTQTPLHPNIDRFLLETLAETKYTMIGCGGDLNDHNTIAAYISKQSLRDPFAVNPFMAPNNGDLKRAPSAQWQVSAPKQELRIAKDQADHSQTSADAPYPESFAQIVEAIQTGKPVDGIREIEERIVREPVSATNAFL